MKSTRFLLAVALLASLPALALEAAPKPADPAKPAADAADAGKATEPSKPVAPEQAAAKKEQEQLALENALAAERLNKELADLRAQAARMKAERDALAERISLEATKRQALDQDHAAKVEAEKLQLAREADLAKVRAETLTAQLKTKQMEWGMEVSKLQSEIENLEATRKRSQFADNRPVYLDNPLKENGMLVISDRRIPLNGLITNDTADYVASRIHFFNNKDPKPPIFLVIDDSPGGSVMAGYRILKAMEGSDAPVHVVVKSFAASMAAAITTLAKESYAYPNAVILHHQISSTLIGRLNLTQQKELFEESQRWWKRLGTPIAAKMGITTEEFIKRMYARSSSGDWPEFADVAKDLKWVNHVVNGIEETALVRHPDNSPTAAQVTAEITGLKEELDKDGRPVVYLPRINPQDVYFVYNPDGYYRLR